MFSDFGDMNKDSLSRALESLSRRLPESSRIFRMDIQESSSLSTEEVHSLGQALHQTHEFLDRKGGVRYGMDDGTLYLWKPDLTPTRLENAYGSLYYCFRDVTTFNRYITDFGGALGLEGRSRDEILKRLDKLAPQLLTDPVEPNCVNVRTHRIRGNHVSLMNDISGKTLSDLNGQISKIAGRGGPGGLQNPRFPGREEREIAISRITATVVSDCTIEPNGVIKYGEPEISRIDRVVESSRRFGDIDPTPRYVEGQGHYMTHFPSVIGIALMSLGIPAGDRTLQNPGLFSSITEGSERVRRAYMEDLICQEGCVGQGKVIWTRANALHAGNKAEKYGFEPKAGEQEIGLIRQHGDCGKKAWSLSWGRLHELAENSDNETARIPANLQEIVGRNRNRLIMDETEIARSLGVAVDETLCDPILPRHR